ncbi:MAG: type II toxin-antitoxin system HicA family toxin [Lachnospiraceae bacterium]|nr:type II toxin-antitoxin system HicA family toxin [Lachnospiraceae bacterium]
MSMWDKLLKRIYILSKDLRFDELRKVLESYGYVMNAPRNGSSHYTFRKSGCQPITIPKHEPIKKVYVEMVKQIVEGEVKNDEDAE